ncbi:MAG TPA: type II toxin-antitoxin system RelE/ParE family toxin [Parachlamydiaceae bacterium]|nr:type II toxin-antitoxin system RelE/ParE family toxin [Parachlamydiaceae bacterium]
MNGTDTSKPLAWIGTSKTDLLDLPGKVQRSVGYALYLSQLGLEHANVKPLSGFGGRGVLEIIEDDTGGTYRAVYTVKFKEAIYVLHAFQRNQKKEEKHLKKKWKLFKKRLKIAEYEHKEWLKRGAK